MMDPFTSPKSTTPQDTARTAYAHGSNRHLFPPLTTPSPSQQQQQQQQRQNAFHISQAAHALSQAGLRAQQHQSPYATPYGPTNAPSVLGRSNGAPGGVVSAEQQIAQGILSNSALGNASPNLGGPPSRRAPSLGTTIHMPQSTSPSQSMSLQHAINPQVGSMHREYAPQRHTTSPGGSSQRHVVETSPGESIGSRAPEVTTMSQSSPQDMSMIDPQLALDQQLHDQDENLEGQMLEQPPAHEHAVVQQGEMLSPPPAGTYPTFDALFAAAQAHALAHGYAFVIGRSKRDNRGLKKVFLICDRGGTNKEKVAGEQRQRKTKSRKCGCEFGVFGLENKVSWVLRGRIDGEHLAHNHPPSDSPTEHPGARKLDPKAIAAVKALEESGVSVKETLEILHRENPSVRYLPRDIYNARAAIKRDPSRVEPTMMESLPTFYKKPPMTFEEKLRAELRTEVANAQAETEKVRAQYEKEVEDLREQLRQKDRQIQKFEMFIDICNERVMVQRERLADGETGPASPP